MAESDASILPDANAVGTAMLDFRKHTPDRRTIGFASVMPPYPNDSAHEPLAGLIKAAFLFPTSDSARKAIIAPSRSPTRDHHVRYLGGKRTSLIGGLTPFVGSLCKLCGAVRTAVAAGASTFPPRKTPERCRTIQSGGAQHLTEHALRRQQEIKPRQARTAAHAACGSCDNACILFLFHILLASRPPDQAVTA